ncbi:MAG: indolepyruvate ferredoxin oxidoreductase family protein [Alphaproteobacteria bacterium]
MTLAKVSLDDKYEFESGRIYLTGAQALVRLPMMQRLRDQTAGLNTAGYVTGYRGSPVHNVDRELWRARKHLAKHHIRFQPGVNEDLAVTALWGTQQAAVQADAIYDGVFGVWYGKGPGLDRSIDAFRHANLVGTSKNGGVLAVVGDDHGMKSSDVPATCEPTFMDLQMPVLYPANVQEVLDLGLYGWALSRFSGAWVGLKIVADAVDASASVEVDPHRVRIVLPEEVAFPPDGVNLRIPDLWWDQEPRLVHHKIPAATLFGRVNALNRVTLESARPRLGIVASGKAYLDVLQALRELGLEGRAAADVGITLFKVSMPYPMDAYQIRQFAYGLEEVIVVEEKRRVIELQVKDALYGLPDEKRPRVVGRSDENGQSLIPEIAELSPDDVTRALGRRLWPFHKSERVTARLAFLDAKAKAKAARAPLSLARLPYFCSGCPHNTSTKVPEGSRALGGVGCHFMSTYMDRRVATHTHMGGEGATWIGQSPYVRTQHVFQNLGDGTYYHSGLLAIRACVAAGVNITYKILFNDAVAMTGGQPVDGPITVPMISHQVQAEGVKRIAVVTDQPDKYPIGAGFAPGTTIHHRDTLDDVQRELREWPGVSVLIYDQVCAAEKRRRRKRGLMEDPQRRVFINESVCEGCGDCNAKSNCLSVVPIETEFGRKRAIDQSSCNKDYSCVEGFCPSFVSVLGGKPRRAATKAEAPASLAQLSDPLMPAIPEGATYDILVTGVGGTGVVTIGALVGMAAHLEGKGASIVDQLGMAQKGGAVVSHIRIARRPEDIHAARLGRGSADLLLGCDMLVAGGDPVLDVVDPAKTRAVINTQESITGHFTRNPDLAFPTERLLERLSATVASGRLDLIEATRLASGLMGDSIATNLFVLGYAFQKGLIPVSSEAILRAIELNGIAVEGNKETFAWGRRAAVDRAAVAALARPPAVVRLRPVAKSLDEIVARRVTALTAYQNAAYAGRYEALVKRVREAEAAKAKGKSGLAEAVARYAFKLMAYKDEYEVARLYTDGEFVKNLNEQFEGSFKLAFHLAPPLFAPRDPKTGELKKATFGPWVFTAFKLLARLKGLRGTPFDVFGHTAERRMERRLVTEYEKTIDEMLARLTPETHVLAVDIASVPEAIRGFGHVKERHVKAALARQGELLAALKNPAQRAAAAE